MTTVAIRSRVASVLYILAPPSRRTQSRCEPLGEDKNLFGPQGFESRNVPHVTDNQVPLILNGISTLLTTQASVVFIKYKFL